MNIKTKFDLKDIAYYIESDGNERGKLKIKLVRIDSIHIEKENQINYYISDMSSGSSQIKINEMYLFKNEIDIKLFFEKNIRPTGISKIEEAYKNYSPDVEEEEDEIDLPF